MEKSQNLREEPKALTEVQNETDQKIREFLDIWKSEKQIMKDDISGAFKEFTESIEKSKTAHKTIFAGMVLCAFERVFLESLSSGVVIPYHAEGPYMPKQKLDPDQLRLQLGEGIRMLRPDYTILLTESIKTERLNNLGLPAAGHEQYCDMMDKTDDPKTMADIGRAALYGKVGVKYPKVPDLQTLEAMARKVTFINETDKFSNKNKKYNGRKKH